MVMRRRSMAIVPFLLSDTKSLELVGEGGNLLFVVALELRLALVETEDFIIAAFDLLVKQLPIF